MNQSKTITCIECGDRLTVPANLYTYPECLRCGKASFECTATGGCPRCAGVNDAEEETTFDPDTCDGYASDGPYCCMCPRCESSSAVRNQNLSEGHRRAGWRVSIVWSRITSVLH